MTPRAAYGSLSGRWRPRDDGLPNLTGALTLETALPAGAKLWLKGWTKLAGGVEFLSLSAKLAAGGPRKRTRGPAEPEGKFRDLLGDGDAQS